MTVSNYFNVSRDLLSLSLLGTVYASFGSKGCELPNIVCFEYREVHLELALSIQDV